MIPGQKLTFWKFYSSEAASGQLVWMSTIKRENTGLSDDTMQTNDFMVTLAVWGRLPAWAWPWKRPEFGSWFNPSQLCGRRKMAYLCSASIFSHIKYVWKNISGDLVVKTSCFQCGGMGSIPGWGTEIPHTMWHRGKKKKKEWWLKSFLISQNCCESLIMCGA